MRHSFPTRRSSDLLFVITSTFPHRTSLWGTRLRHSASSPPPTTLPELQLLNLTQSLTIPTVESHYCDARFGAGYLDDLRQNSFQYCTHKPDSEARLTCFHTRRRTLTQIDSFCIAQGASLDTSQKRYTLDCVIQRPSREELKRGIIPFTAIRGYWYETGPRNVFYKVFTAFKLASKLTLRPPISSRSLLPSLFRSETQPIFTILVKREGERNLWHSLMEIWSLTQSLDVLRLTADPRTGSPFFHTQADVPNAQVVILDDHPDGPYFDLWTMLAGRPPVRLEQALKSGKFKQGTMLAASPGTKHNVVVPMAGAANPIWANDWEDRNCEDAPLLKLFVRRVLNHIGVKPFEAEAPSTPISQAQTRKIRLTYIVRKESRRILHFDALLASARLAFPDVEPRLVDLTSLSFAEQVRVVHDETEVLVGVHGAGLTHAMFLDGEWANGGGKAMVEIQPDIMQYKGFHNLARMLGHGYFMAKGHSMSEQDLEEDAAKEGQSGDRTRRRMENGENTGDSDDLHSKSEDIQTHEDQDDYLHKRLDWHFVDVTVNETQFLDVIGEAVGYVRRWRESALN